MATTPIDVRNKQFNVGLRGYDATDVRDFLEEVASELERLRQDKNDLTSRLRGANDRLQTIGKRESQVQGLLDTAEKTIRDRMSTAHAKGQAVLAQAHAEAEEIVMRSRRDHTDIQNDISNLQAQRERFRVEMKAQLRAHADLLVRTGGGMEVGTPYDSYETGDVAEILDGPQSVDVDLGARRIKEDPTHSVGGGTNGRTKRRMRLRRNADRIQVKPGPVDVAN